VVEAQEANQEEGRDERGVEEREREEGGVEEREREERKREVRVVEERERGERGVEEREMLQRELVKVQRQIQSQRALHQRAADARAATDTRQVQRRGFWPQLRAQYVQQCKHSRYLQQHALSQQLEHRLQLRLGQKLSTPTSPASPQYADETIWAAGRSLCTADLAAVLHRMCTLLTPLLTKATIAVGFVFLCFSALFPVLHLRSVFSWHLPSSMLPIMLPVLREWTLEACLVACYCCCLLGLLLLLPFVYRFHCFKRDLVLFESSPRTLHSVAEIRHQVSRLQVQKVSLVYTNTDYCPLRCLHLDPNLQYLIRLEMRARQAVVEQLVGPYLARTVGEFVGEAVSVPTLEGRRARAKARAEAAAPKAKID
jgi:hypothetical protein